MSMGQWTTDPCPAGALATHYKEKDGDVMIYALCAVMLCRGKDPGPLLEALLRCFNAWLQNPCINQACFLCRFTTSSRQI